MKTQPLSLLPLSLPLSLSLALVAAPAAAQIVIVDGDDLAAAVAAAPDGETIVIQSDETFVGTLAWSDKTLTIRAGLGYSPTVKGSFDASAISLSPTPGHTGATFRGLRLVPGDFAAGGSAPICVNFSGTAAGVETGDFNFVDSTVLGTISASGTGSVQYDVALENVDVPGFVSIGGTGDMSCSVAITQDSRVGRLAVNSTGDAIVDLTVLDSRILDSLEISPTSASAVAVNVRRTQVLGPVSATPSLAAIADVELASCLIAGDGTGTGISTNSDADMLGVNLTVTGFAVGLSAAIGSEFHNLAVFGNGDDLAPVVLPIQISTSLIEDGTYAGFFGNFAGTPQVTADFALASGSIGIDAGNSGAPMIGLVDLNGDPRVQDGDGDGAPRVNVGAVETVSPCAVAGFTYFNGSGTNPTAYSVTQLPVLGASFEGEIAVGPETVATILALGTSSASPLILPGYEGEILLELAPFPLLDVAVGTHVLPVPADPNLCGVILDTQGLRADLEPFGVVIRMTNGARLTLGQ